MYLIAIAWFYVVLMMAVAEATSTNGTVMGAFVTFGFYGVLPVSLLMYILGTPQRKKRLKAEQETREAQSGGATTPATDPSVAPDRGGVAAGDAVAAERKEP